MEAIVRCTCMNRNVRKDADMSKALRVRTFACYLVVQRRFEEQQHRWGWRAVMPYGNAG